MRIQTANLRAHTLKTLQAICSEVIGVEESEVKLTSSFFEDLGVSMEELAEILSRIEQTFTIRINRDEIPTITTVAELLDLIEEEL